MPNFSKNITIPIGSETMGAYLSRPSGRAIGSMLLIQEIFGVTPAMRAIADDFANAGQIVIVPDIYWRLDRDLDLGNGEDEAQRNLAVAFSNRYDETQGVQDLVAAVDYLAEYSQSSVRPSVLGFCLGGRLSVRVAAAAQLSSAVTMYGVGLDQCAKDIQRAGCPIQFHYGENDNHNPVQKIDAVRTIVAARGNAQDEFFTYPQAEHAFYNRHRFDRFDEQAHELARSRVLSFIERQG